MSNMDRYALLIVFTLGCANALSQKEWRAAILESYADWTMASNSGDYQRVIDLFTEDGSEMVPKHPAMTKEEFYNIKINKKDTATLIVYLGYDDLLFWDEKFALAQHSYYVNNKHSYEIIAEHKGLRLFVEEEGQVKIKKSAFNSYGKE